MQQTRNTVVEVFRVFLLLGLTSFGGPVAHLGYFRTEFVARRRWLDDAAYADLVALCQFLPGPASSQVGIAIGKLRAGLDLANAAVVGLLLATLYEPVFTSAVFGPLDLAWAVAALALLLIRTPPWLVVLLSAAVGAGLALL